MRYKIKEIYEQAYQSETPLLSDLSNEVWQAIYPYVKDDNGDATTYNFMTDYLDSNQYQRLDSRFAAVYGDKFFIKESDNIINCLATFKMNMTNEIITHLPELARLYYALQLSYNPLYNKDVRDTETVTGDDTHKHEGVLTDSKENGDTQTEYTHEGLTDSGKPTGNTGVMDHMQTDTEYAVPTNDTTEYEERKKVTASEPMRSAETATDVSTVTHGRGITTETDHTETITHDTTRDLWSRGNQGITKSTELLRDEYSLRLSTAFWDALYKLVTTNYISYL